MMKTANSKQRVQKQKSTYKEGVFFPGTVPAPTWLFFFFDKLVALVETSINVGGYLKHVSDRKEYIMQKLKIILLAVVVVIGMTSCTQTQANQVSYNLSLEADSFNVIRRLTVINCIQGDVLFSMEGKMSLGVDAAKQKIDIIVEDENGDYQKHMVGLSDNVTYTIEQLKPKEVSNYQFTLNYNPKMWIPFDVKTID